ncbi:MFS transporter [Fusarium solani]|uniref:MFS transporter n=1 Tax=Fusarium solani TaxID=169388 RepID=A0A9P9GFC6_FUSSL|nr:MFS transporter [Fusarium solani]KAH7237921.1 MFS transporter [Fusarium solani]
MITGDPVTVDSDKVQVGTPSSKHHGVGLWPPPSSDPADPLRWPRWVKFLALLAVAIFNFVANFAGAGLSVATVMLEVELQKTPQQIKSLMSYNFLLLGLGNLVWIPLSAKYGKRPIMIASMALLFAVLLWTAKAGTYEELLAARILSGFASASGESIVPGIVSDIFFLHERGTATSIYVVLISAGSAVGPLIGGFMVEYSPGTWRDFCWLCAALAGFDLLAIYFLYPESSFTRPHPTAAEQGTIATDIENTQDQQLDENEDFVVEFSYRQVAASFLHVNKSLSLFKAFAMPFAFLPSLIVLWVVFLYGSALASLTVLILAFPSLLLPPPYNFPSSSVGLMQIPAIIGFALATFGGGYICDLITVRMIKRGRGVFVPELRLVSMAPGSFIGPVGCIIVALTCANKLHWASIAVGYGMVAFGVVYAPNVAVTYLVDCYPAFAPDVLVIVNIVKNTIAFVFLYTAVDWVRSQGWIQVYFIMFMLVSLSMVLTIPLYLWGNKARQLFMRMSPREVREAKL